MSKPVISIAEPCTIAIAGSDDYFPVNRIFCVGRNYAAHSIEMGDNPDRDPPFFFCKPADTVLSGSSVKLAYPPRTQELHYEVEMVIGLKDDCVNVSPEQALQHVFGAAVGIEFTRRDLQNAAKKQGRPWDMGKGFDGSAVIGEMTAFNQQSLPQQGALSLQLNGEYCQQCDLSDLIWSISETIAELSSYLTLRAGDIIFTGTPDGVGPVVVGDRLVAQCAGLSPLKAEIISA
jgi:fumarylpyruvate hydrolase